MERWFGVVMEGWLVVVNEVCVYRLCFDLFYIRGDCLSDGISGAAPQPLMYLTEKHTRHLKYTRIKPKRNDQIIDFQGCKDHFRNNIMEETKFYLQITSWQSRSILSSNHVSVLLYIHQCIVTSTLRAAKKTSDASSWEGRTSVCG